MTFVGEAAEQPLIANVVRQFQVDANILQGKISQTHQGAYGVLFVHMDGEKEEVARAIDYIRNQQVAVEVITNAR